MRHWVRCQPQRCRHRPVWLGHTWSPLQWGVARTGRRGGSCFWGERGRGGYEGQDAARRSVPGAEGRCLEQWRLARGRGGVGRRASCPTPPPPRPPAGRPQPLRSRPPRRPRTGLDARDDTGRGAQQERDAHERRCTDGSPERGAESDGGERALRGCCGVWPAPQEGSADDGQTGAGRAEAKEGYQQYQRPGAHRRRRVDGGEVQVVCHQQEPAADPEEAGGQQEGAYRSPGSHCTPSVASGSHLGPSLAAPPPRRAPTARPRYVSRQSRIACL